MPAYFSAPVGSFLTDDIDRIIGKLQTGVSNEGFASHHNTQTAAWQEQITLLQLALTDTVSAHSDAKGWHILIEYPIPRRQRRIDAVIIAGNVIQVLEFKIGAKSYDANARRQVEDYAIDLRDFHLSSRERIIVPILVATQAKHSVAPIKVNGDFVYKPGLTNASELGQAILDAYLSAHDTNQPPIDPISWDHSAYHPVPTIIEAAEMLYAGQSVREISSSHAGAINLTTTTDRILEAIHHAQQTKSKVICFVTGIPGAGKTLAGLNVVHAHDASRPEHPSVIFLSGNGPLVSIVREALAQDEKTRNGTSLRVARHNTSVFIQNVHTFINNALTRMDNHGIEHVVVFDEAQRAWNAEKQLRKFNRDISEPALLLSIMDRHQDWAFIVALVGGGQEIHDGEAGLSEWGAALSSKFCHWRILASPEVITGGTSLAGNCLFPSGVPENGSITTDTALHLAVSLRSFRASAVALWVNYVLAGNVPEAYKVASEIRQFPMKITRSLDTACEWLRHQMRGLRRCGLVASSEAKRLRPYGIEVSSQFRSGISFDQWFLMPVGDIRSSSQLEVAATEFNCQGLELDWIAICWDNDLHYDQNKGQWIARRFSGNSWRTVNSVQNQQYALNKYRVLLTRAREGFIIWVPPGDDSDHTRQPIEYDATAQFLCDCGLTLI